MSSSSSSSSQRIPETLYEHCRRIRILLSVGMDDIQIMHAPPQGIQRAIGTEGLNGCSCLIVSGAAVILGHVSPLPGSTEDWEGTSDAQRSAASLNHHTRFLERVTQLYSQHRDEFPVSTTTWGVFGRGLSPFLEPVASMFRRHLRDLGHEMQDSYYKEREVQRDQNPSPWRGAQLVVIRGRGQDGIYLDRQKLEEGPGQSLAPGAQSNARIAPTPSAAAVASSSRTERPQARIQGSGGLAQTNQPQSTMAEYVGMAKRRLDEMMAQGYSLESAISALKPTLMRMTGLNPAQADQILRGNRS